MPISLKVVDPASLQNIERVEYGAACILMFLLMNGIQFVSWWKQTNKQIIQAQLIIAYL